MRCAEQPFLQTRQDLSTAPHTTRNPLCRVLDQTFSSLPGLQGCLETRREGDRFITQLFLQTPTTFSKGAAPNTLKTGLGLEGEMQRTMACCPTRVVYSSSVARSFLKHRTANSYQLRALQKHDPGHCKFPFLTSLIHKAGEKQSLSGSDQLHIRLVPQLQQACCLPCAHPAAQISIILPSLLFPLM